MKDLLKFIVQSLVEHPRKVKIEEREGNDGFTYSIKPDPSDMGKIIGKQGKIIKAIRTLIRTRAIKEGKRVQIVLEEQTPV